MDVDETVPEWLASNMRESYLGFYVACRTNVDCAR